MDDKTKAQLCRKMIKNFYENGCGEPEERPPIMSASDRCPLARNFQKNLAYPLDIPRNPWYTKGTKQETNSNTAIPPPL